MRVLQLGKFYPIVGGVEKVMWDLTTGLNAAGVDCDMLCAAKEPQIIPMGGNGKCICVKSLFKAAATMISPAMIVYLRRHRAEYDIIHVHHPDPMAALALFLSGYKGKIVLHWHSDILKQRILRFFYLPLQNWMISHSSQIVGTTPVYVQQSPCLRKAQDKVTCIPIGVEPVESVPVAPEEKKIVFSLGRLVGYKGYQYLVDAAKYLPEDYRIVIGGEGPLHQELQEHIDNNGLQDKVTLLGRVPQEDIPAWFSRCSVFCLSSIWKTEAFAIVQIEAMSCSKPIVATRIPGSGVSWVNAHGYSGLNVEPCDARQLADAILQITTDNDRYLKYCSDARARYESEFTFGGMIEKAIKLYDKVLTKQREK